MQIEINLKKSILATMVIFICCSIFLIGARSDVFADKDNSKVHTVKRYDKGAGCPLLTSDSDCAQERCKRGNRLAGLKSCPDVCEELGESGGNCERNKGEGAGSSWSCYCGEGEDDSSDDEDDDNDYIGLYMESPEFGVYDAYQFGIERGLEMGLEELEKGLAGEIPSEPFGEQKEPEPLPHMPPEPQ